jgi:hypothetical protein
MRPDIEAYIPVFVGIGSVGFRSLYRNDFRVRSKSNCHRYIEIGLIEPVDDLQKIAVVDPGDAQGGSFTLLAVLVNLADRRDPAAAVANQPDLFVEIRSVDEKLADPLRAQLRRDLVLRIVDMIIPYDRPWVVGPVDDTV